MIYTTCTYTGMGNLDGKTVIITGANKGIGYETALDLAKRQARVIMACRDVPHAESMATHIKLQSGNENVFVRKLDLSSLESVREFAKKFLLEEQRLDILINNAGMPTYTPRKTIEGFEVVFVTNYLGHFLLTKLLLDLLMKSAPSRIINVSSLAHKMVRTIDLEDLNCEKTTTTISLYGRSKALQILFTKELSRQLDGIGVTVNCLHPGSIASSFYHKLPQPFYTLAWIADTVKLLKTPKQGAQTTIYAAVDESFESISGQYLDSCQIATPSNLMTDAELAKKVFEISESYVALYL
ncbi:hypothetical protein HELRODRAFT_109820 [Helobdella robusta]|uniref:Uncharacterized protein n=1 Tax=Helobdella robusta TaxID=6412 RepID=T1EEW6_HELRO|nr:hypothetical protein HELRODRAFT_109820 [Helobdella robusta]ESO08769.1 hypothetical protein HELRODRAFT_109820 [Helobdella robusta]